MDRPGGVAVRGVPFEYGTLWFKSRLCHVRDIKAGTVKAVLPKALHYKVSSGRTGRSGASKP